MFRNATCFLFLLLLWNGQVFAVTHHFEGTFVNTTFGSQGTVTMDLDLTSPNAVTGYINFTNLPGNSALCAAGNISGTLVNDSVLAGFYSFDLDPGCGFDWGLYIDLRIKLFNGCDSIAGAYMYNGLQSGVFNMIKTSATSCNIGTGLFGQYQEAKQLRIYPNPSSGWVTIEALDSRTSAQLKVINILGQIFATHQATFIGGNEHLDLSNLEDGIYFIQINDGDSVVTRRLILDPLD